MCRILQLVDLRLATLESLKVNILYLNDINGEDKRSMPGNKTDFHTAYF